MAVHELGSAHDREQAGRAAAGRSGRWAWPLAVGVRHRAVTLVPLLALAGVALAGLAGLPGFAELGPGGNGSGCCPPAH